MTGRGIWGWLQRLFTFRRKGWKTGPVIHLKTRSPGCVLFPKTAADGSFTVDIPATNGLHYVTRRCGPLLGKAGIKLRYRLEGAVYPVTSPTGPPLLTIYFQREGDDWGANGKYEVYRWYASFATVVPVVPGEHEVNVLFADNWTAVRSSSAESNHEAFTEALANAGRVGFVLGGGDGLGHGVYGPARLTMLEFTVA